MKKGLLFVVTLISLNSIAQKVDVGDDHIITVDKQNYAMIDREGCGMFEAECKFNVFDLDSTKQIVIMFRSYKDYMEIKPANKEGIVRYCEFVFLKSKKKAEVGSVFLKSAKMAKIIVKANLFIDGKLDEAAVDEFVTINGTPFSDRARKL